VSATEYLFRLWNDGVQLARDEYDIIRAAEDQATRRARGEIPPRITPTGPARVPLICPYCEQEFMGAPLHRGPGSGPSPHCGDRVCFLAHAQRRQKARRSSTTSTVPA
jgi:hypothetical protein